MGNPTMTQMPTFARAEDCTGTEDQKSIKVSDKISQLILIARLTGFNITILVIIGYGSLRFF